MNNLYWISIIVAVVAFGALSKHDKANSRIDGIFIILYILAFILSLLNSGSLKVGIITAVVLFFGNGLFWSIVWRRKSNKFQELLKHEK